jgi:mannose-6-phosphate isomerase-like protein (cupin superfamily)
MPSSDATTRSTHKYRVQGTSGYLVTPPEAGHELVTIGHSAQVAPWADPDIHLHESSEEFYILLRGELWLLVAGELVTLKPMEVLMVKPRVPHAIVRGAGSIEHFGLRAPAIGDRQKVGIPPEELPPACREKSRELRCDWGTRIPLEEERNRNCWLIGYGAARFPSSHLILAYLDFPTVEAANAGIGSRHRLHLHQESWEYYVVLEGTKTLRVEDELVTLKAGEMLEVPPGVRHTLYARQAPYQGFTMRVPILGHDDKVEY